MSGYPVVCVCLKMARSPNPPPQRTRLRAPPSRKPLGQRVPLVLGALLLVVTPSTARPTARATPTRRATATPTPTVGQALSVGRPIPLRATDLVKVQGAYFVEFSSAPPAVVVEYETDISVSNMSALTSQADKLIKLFQADIDATGVRTAVLRATHFEGSGRMREGNGYGFIYAKDANGIWVREEDNRR